MACRSQHRRTECKVALGLAATLLCSSTSFAGAFVEPAVFASSNGLLDLLMIAQAQPVPSLPFFTASGSVINPIGWVYQICPRSAALPNNQCPAGSPTVSDYGGVRLALQQGDTLKIRLVNRLPALDPTKVDHSIDPGGTNLPLNLTNLHTHGLIVEARAPTLADPTFGDYIFMQIYNSANGTPVPQDTHQHGSLVKDFADYRIDIPRNHPSGAFWFHPHIHGLSLNQVSSGLAGIISVGSAGDYAFGDLVRTPFPESNVRHLILKDMQVLAANPALQFANGTAPVVDGEVLNQQASPFCHQFRGEDPPRLGYCLGTAANLAPGANSSPGSPPAVADYTGGRWYFTINGRQYPTINITEANGELWRLTNASGSLTYDLQLVDSATQTPMMMQLVSVDGVSIDVPPATMLGNMIELGGARFRVVACPASTTTGLSSTPVCINEFAMMPSSRAEVYVIYRDQNGNVVTPPPGASATLKMIGLTTGPGGDQWPTFDLASVDFTQSGAGAARIVATALDVHGDARAAYQPGGIFSAPVPYANAAPVPAGCKPLARNHHRRIFFGLPDPTTPAIFGMGYEEVDENGAAIPGTEVPLTAFDPTANTICIPLGPRQTPVSETWELVNLATENHNFHIHQTRFRFVQDPTAGAGVIEDNLPLPVAVANISDVANDQNGYCTIAQWRGGQCTSPPIVVQNTFSQLGEFVYHCHILTHEDGGMMAKIQVVPSPSPARTNSHDFNGDGWSDIAWRDSSGNVAIWLIDAGHILSTGSLGNVPTTWTIVAQRDFDGDGDYDLLWRDTSGNTAIWFMNGAQVASTAGIGNIPTNWMVAGTADFNGDGLGDILWLDNAGNVSVWLMNGANLISSTGLGAVGTSWAVAGTGDFNGDGKADILWRDSNTGTVGIWLLNGEAVAQAASLGVVPGSWRIVGTGDFNGDGMSDILWRDDSNDLAVWLMQGTSILQAGGIGTVGSAWSIAETGDFNGDGKSDLLWRDTSGNTAIWYLNGTSVSTETVGNIPPTWTVQGVNAD
jgi:L-ascorbate oxidase